MKVVVTQRHINEGSRNNACWCPIALALRETKRESSHVFVVPEYAIVGNQTYIMPVEAGRFIHWFDDGYQVVPFEFEMELMQ